MVPVSLQISGFLSYLDPIKIDFSTFELACISGANGSGKSSLIDAITWVLFGQARRRDDAIINSHASAAEVVYEFLYEGIPYRVQRSKPKDKSTLLEFYVQEPGGSWRPLTEHSVRETEQRIQQTLRMDYETFINASFFLQGKADQFAQQRPGDRKRILSSILGLEVWETYRERSFERRKQLEADLAGLDALLEEITAELNQADERKSHLKQLEESLAQVSALRKAREDVRENLRRLETSLAEQKRLSNVLEGQLQAARQRLEGHSADLQARQQDRQQYLDRLARETEVKADYQRWTEARHDLERWDAVAANFHQYENQRSIPLMAIEAERSRLEQERQGLVELDRQAIDLQNQKPLLQAQLAEAQLNVEQSNVRLERRSRLENELRELQDNRSVARAENEHLFPQMKELKERIDQLKTTSGADCPLCGQPLSPDERQQLIASLEIQGKEMGDRYRSNQDLIRRFDQDRQTMEAELKALQKVELDLRQQQRQVDQSEDRLRQIQKVLSDWQAGGALRLQEVNAILSEGKYALKERMELARIDESLKELGYDAVAHDAVRLSEQEGRNTEEQLRLLENARAALDPLKREIAGLEKQLTADEADVTQKQADFQQAETKYQAEAASLPDLDQVESELNEVREQENRLRMQFGGALQAVEVLDLLKARKAEKLVIKEDLTHQIARLKTLERAFSKDGVPALLIEQALPEIESQANGILDRLSDGNMSVRFATQKDYKDKNRDDKKETMDILISDSAGVREYELFSGGEAFRINFAIRLALSRVLAQRAGARLQTLVIDEGFGSQDSEGRQRLIEAINQVRPDFAKVLVITHLEELKDAFSTRIEVEKTGRGSQVRVVV
ncbi:MAG TPA: SMC family ATPase [Anaerolineaceae bacterium]|nr:SMC family ATPase [Anaerolineaceae bacterium]